MSQAGSLIPACGGGGGDVVRTGVGVGVGAVVDDGLEASLGAILGMMR